MTVRTINKNIREGCSWRFVSCSALNLDPWSYHRQKVPVAMNDAVHGGPMMVKCAQVIMSDDTRVFERKVNKSENQRKMSNFVHKSFWKSFLKLLKSVNVLVCNQCFNIFWHYSYLVYDEPVLRNSQLCRILRAGEILLANNYHQHRTIPLRPSA